MKYIERYAGVPQGSLLGLQFLILLTNDIKTPIFTMVAAYVDDRAVYAESRNYFLPLVNQVNQDFPGKSFMYANRYLQSNVRRKAGFLLVTIKYFGPSFRLQEFLKHED